MSYLNLAHYYAAYPQHAWPVTPNFGHALETLRLNRRLMLGFGFWPSELYEPTAEMGLW